ncbi:MAG: hypothetical protein Q8S15_00415 [Erysipelotrichaceae bacterium]|nr:hypothetical protein [Erysipelotrichaceae bacterium]MDP3304529.1 hypothetical protein [Erysipelotrichaceae bacterium]
MKKLFALLLTILMVLSMSITVFAGPPVSTRTIDSYSISSTDAEFLISELLAGQDIPVGHLFIDPLAEEDTYLVTYLISEPDWFLTEVHFEAISEGDDAFIYSSGGLVPGKFTVKKSWSLTDEVTKFSFIYVAGAEVTDFAAHAVVKQHAVYNDVPHVTTVVSDTNTLFSPDGIDNWQPAVLAWDHGSWPQISGAEWIWESYKVDAPRVGDTIYFKRDFSILGTPTSASLKIAADNEFYAMINELPNPAFFNNNWAIIKNYDVLDYINEGQNSLNIKGVNWAWNTDNPEVNPGAIVYELVVNSTEKVLVTPEVSESVWGYGVRVNQEKGGNWSMIISVPEVVCSGAIETLEVPSKIKAGIDSSVLKDGYKYCVKATGTYKFANWAPPAESGFADAKFNCREGTYIPSLTGKNAEEDYHVNSDGTVWINGQEFWPNYSYLQVLIDGQPVMWIGEYNDEHIYTQTIVGTGSKIKFSILDDAYGDNSGFITVDIQKQSFYLAP